MEANTRYFGAIDYEQGDILHLPEGLFGFEDQKEYLLIHFEQNDGRLLCMQSLQNEELAFVIANPFCFKPDYHPSLTKEDMDALELTDDSSVSFYVICVMHDDVEDSTINLRCPIAINPETRRARQIILENDSYTFKHSLRDLSPSGDKEVGTC